MFEETAQREQEHGNVSIRHMFTDAFAYLILGSLQVPVRHRELQNEKAVALKDYKDAFGKLRYAINLRQEKVDGGHSNAQQLQQQSEAGPSTSPPSMQGPTAGTGTLGAGPSGKAHEDDRQAETHSDKENSEGRVPQTESGGMQLPQHALEVHRKIAQASAHLLAQPLQEGPPGAEECPICNEFIVDKCGPLAHRLLKLKSRTCWTVHSV